MGILREVKVGVFVFLGLLAIGLVVFLIGNERGLFSAKCDYRIIFSDVQGLKPGSMVRMGGVDVGSVTGVDYSDDPTDPRLHVRISVASGEARRIREDSFAVIESKGLLGDRMIRLEVGSPDRPALAEGATIQSRKNEGLEAMLGKVSKIGDTADRVMENLESTTTTLADEDFRHDLQASVRNISGVMESLNQGSGYVGLLLRDPTEAQRLSRAVAGLERASLELGQTISRVNAIVARVEEGPGFAHDLLYSDAPTETVTKFGNAAHEVAMTLKGIREGSGPARSLLYGDKESGELMDNLNATSRDIRQIVADVRAGRGTLGALLVDPSVYEDIKVVLGNVGRNKALKALVRYSIKRDETPPKVEVVDPRPATGAGAR
ncbi:MlaD family protein [Myxococcota bacterium]